MLCIYFLGISLSFNTYSQGLGDVKQLCDNATAANKAMARQAGYDLDQLCGEITFVGQAKNSSPRAPAPVARDTVSSDLTNMLRGGCAGCCFRGRDCVKPPPHLKPFGYDLVCQCANDLCSSRQYSCVGRLSIGTWRYAGYSVLWQDPIMLFSWISIGRDLLISRSWAQLVLRA